MKTTLAVLGLFISSMVFVQAQPPTYDDLLIMFADEDYDKLLKKAEKYTLKDDTKRDAIPYVFLSRANFEISKDAELLEKYPKAFKDAVKFAGKAIKKDKEGLVYDEFRDYFSELKKTLLEELENYVIEEDYRKAEGTVRNILKIDEEDLGGLFMMAYIKDMNGDINGARQALNEAFERLDATTSISNYRSEDIKLLKMGFMKYSLHAHNGGKTNEAKKVINKGYQWFDEDEEYKKAYDEIVN